MSNTIDVIVSMKNHNSHIWMNAGFEFKEAGNSFLLVIFEFENPNKIFAIYKPKSFKEVYIAREEDFEIIDKGKDRLYTWDTGEVNPYTHWYITKKNIKNEELEGTDDSKLSG